MELYYLCICALKVASLVSFLSFHPLSFLPNTSTGLRVVWDSSTFEGNFSYRERELGMARDSRWKGEDGSRGNNRAR